jgi:hypothetical protein
VYRTRVGLSKRRDVARCVRWQQWAWRRDRAPDAQSKLVLLAIVVDGFHRWQAHRREGLAEIASVDLGNLTDIEIRRESITRNAAHGQQLSAQDKKRLAGILWHDLAASSNCNRVAEIAEWLSVSERTVRKNGRTRSGSRKRRSSRRRPGICG